MAYSPPRAVYDACVLYPFHLRNLLIQCAADRLVEAAALVSFQNVGIPILASSSSSSAVMRARSKMPP